MKENMREIKGDLEEIKQKNVERDERMKNVERKIKKDEENMYKINNGQKEIEKIRSNMIKDKEMIEELVMKVNKIGEKEEKI